MGFNLIYWNPMSGSCLFVWFYFGKMWKFSEKPPFFRADMAGLGKYHMGGYGRIGVYRVKLEFHWRYKNMKKYNSLSVFQHD